MSEDRKEDQFDNPMVVEWLDDDNKIEDVPADTEDVVTEEGRPSDCDFTGRVGS